MTNPRGDRHGVPDELCNDYCFHPCPSCQRGEPCEDLFLHPTAGLIACTVGP